MQYDDDIVYWMTVKGTHVPIRKGQSKAKAWTDFLDEVENDSHKRRDHLPDKISLPDETLPRSIGAKWANYDILMSDGSIGHLLEGSKLHHKEVFAGNGCKRKIDEEERLLSRYGGTRGKWQKIKAFGLVVREDGTVEEIEIHWYEEPTVGKVKLKEKI